MWTYGSTLFSSSLSDRKDHAFVHFVVNIPRLVWLSYCTALYLFGKVISANINFKYSLKSSFVCVELCSMWTNLNQFVGKVLFHFL